MISRRGLLQPLALLVCGGLLGLVASLLVSPGGSPPAKLLATARDLIETGQPLAALKLAEHIREHPGALDDPREIDAVAAWAQAELGRCDDALALLDTLETGEAMTSRLQADCDLVRLQCAARRRDREQAELYFSRLIQTQTGTPAAARAHTIFDSAFHERSE